MSSLSMLHEGKIIDRARPTDVLPCRPVGYCVKNTIEPTGVVYSLLVPHHVFIRPFARVWLSRRLVCLLLALVHRRGWEDEDKRESRSPGHGEDVWLVNREDVLKGKGLGHAEAVQDLGENVRVGLDWEVSLAYCTWHIYTVFFSFRVLQSPVHQDYSWLQSKLDGLRGSQVGPAADASQCESIDDQTESPM
jgi:hypothetical protein